MLGKAGREIRMSFGRWREIEFWKCCCKAGEALRAWHRLDGGVALGADTPRKLAGLLD